MKLVTSAQMRDLEARAEAAGVSSADLMQNAGLALAQEAWMLLGTLEDRRIVVLVGPGNNGGDGLVAARHLAEWGVEVPVLLLQRRDDDPLVAALRELDVPMAILSEENGIDLLRGALGGADLVIDALLGTGSSRPIEGVMAEALDAVATARTGAYPPKILAADLPSGLDADSGAVDPHTLPADQTVAFGLPKIGHYTPQRDVIGRLQTVEIGIPAGLDQELPLELLQTRWVREHLPERPPNANKGTFGKVLSLTGSLTFPGAAYLATAAAARAGAGLVTFACARTLIPILSGRLAEGTFLPLADEDGFLAASAVDAIVEEAANYTVLLAGPGLSQRAAVAQALRALLPRLKDGQTRLVLDADALNILSATDNFAALLPAGCILTPHPGEMARLTGRSVAEVQAHRLDIALAQAKAWNAVIVLKGAGTVVAAPDGRAWLAPFATAALASAGTGDVLAGAIAGLLAQGMEPGEAAACGVFLHGTAGELLRKEMGDSGVLASDVLEALPRARLDVLGLTQPAAAGMGLGNMAGLGNLGGLGNMAGLGGLGAAGGLGGLPGGGLGGLGGLGGPAAP
jgi:ADP-dependent NAD(P)H-hydrate dehydratase / NAD(P)H-hydrate epimerase